MSELTTIASRNAELADALRAICKRFDVDTNMSAEDAAKSVLEALERDWMRLPVDADGVPVRIGDTMERICAEDRDVFTVGLIGADGYCMDDETSFFKASECRHVQPDTVESLLCDMIHEYGSTDALTETVAEKYAERIRKAVDHG